MLTGDAGAGSAGSADSAEMVLISPQDGDDELGEIVDELALKLLSAGNASSSSPSSGGHVDAVMRVGSRSEGDELALSQIPSSQTFAPAARPRHVEA